MPRRKPEVLVKRRGHVLADIRATMEKTQAAMARLLDVHTATLASWETGARPMPAYRLDQLRVLVSDSRLLKRQRDAFLSRIEAVR